ncbi:hypothetical protein FTUN_6556 [Frigoriglobus tundricola]|uniref:Uncharacterized protein n=2 Tax=Frigoriglobus tundricola TaxID=2774151 RepID=A0A6M5Z0L4_9BACT|nr:hypothetical protein FTUN_6556 [Frigoriglobus tundricola]
MLTLGGGSGAPAVPAGGATEPVVPPAVVTGNSMFGGGTLRAPAGVTGPPPGPAGAASRGTPPTGVEPGGWAAAPAGGGR